MKRLIIAIATLVASISFISAQNLGNCTLKVTLSQEKLDKHKGEYLYIKTENPVDSIKEPLVLDSVKIEKLQTTISGLKPIEGSVNIATLSLGKKTRPVIFILDNGTVNIDLTDKDARIGGTPINEDMWSFDSKNNSIVKEARAKLAALSDTLKTISDAEKRAELQQAVIIPAQAELKENAKKFFEKHPNDAVGLRALMSLVGEEETIEAQKALIASAGELVRSQKPVIKLLKSLENLEATQEGKPFRDFAGKNDKGEDVKLSNHVGKGHYTLVDFWASWCGPCRREIPNLITIYEQYKGKGLEVVGVAVWDKMEDHLDAVKQMGIEYPQIFNETEATELYGIKGIPQIILFAPDGTIVKRDLRGEEIQKILEEKLGK